MTQELLTSTWKNTISHAEQHDKIRHAYDTWNGDGKQIDCLLLIVGIKF